MNKDKKIWVIKPSESQLWKVKTGDLTVYIERIWIAEWIFEKWTKGDVIIVEHVDADSTETKSM